MDSEITARVSPPGLGSYHHITDGMVKYLHVDHEDTKNGKAAKNVQELDPLSNGHRRNVLFFHEN
jgi:hypothetical protein